MCGVGKTTSVGAQNYYARMYTALLLGPYIKDAHYNKLYAATRNCRDTGTAMIHFWLPGCVRRRLQRVTLHVTSAGSGGRRHTLRPPPLLIRPGAAATAAAAAATAAGAAAAPAGAAV